MNLFPRTIPLISDPQVVHALAARWQRTRFLLLVATVALPTGVGLVCVALAGMTAAGHSVMPWWSAIPAVAAGACACALMTWLRRNGWSDPGSWLPATTLMTGAQVILGVLPGSGIALRLSPGAALAVKALCAAGVLGAGSAGALARLARRSLLAVPIVELGSTAFPLTLTGPDTRLVVGTDRLDWSTGKVHAGVAYARIQGISTNADAIIVHTASGSWTVPVDDPALTKALLRRRITWWEEQGTAEIERERQRYLDLVHLLAGVSGHARTRGVEVTVDSNGVPTDIKLGASVRELRPDDIAQHLMACLGKARKDAHNQVATLVLEHAEAQFPRSRAVRKTATVHRFANPIHKSVV